MLKWSRGLDTMNEWDMTHNTSFGLADFDLSPEFWSKWLWCPGSGFLNVFWLLRQWREIVADLSSRWYGYYFWRSPSPWYWCTCPFSVCASAHTPCSALDCESVYCLWMCAFGGHLKRSTRYHPWLPHHLPLWTVEDGEALKLSEVSSCLWCKTGFELQVKAKFKGN